MRHTINWSAPALPILLAVILLGTGESQNRETGLRNEDAAAFTGCYQIKLGRWWPWGYGEEAKCVTPPDNIALLPDRGTEGFEKDHLLIRSIPRANATTALPGRRGGAFWDVQGSHVYMTWTSGYTAVNLKLKKSGDQLVGWAHPFFDSWRLVPHIAHVKVQSIPCK